MKSVSRAVFLIAALMWATSPARAESGTQPSSKYYLGLDVGISHLDATLSQQFFGPQIGRQSGDDVGYGLRFGVQFSRYVALEASLTDFGDFDMHDIPYTCASQQPGPCTYELSSSTKGATLSAVGSWPFAERWSLNGRLGTVYMDVSTSERDPDVPASAANYSNSGWGLQYGVGLSYYIQPRLRMSLDWAQYDQVSLGLTLGGSPGAYTVNSSSLASLGLSYRF